MFTSISNTSCNPSFSKSMLSNKVSVFSFSYVTASNLTKNCLKFFFKKKDSLISFPIFLYLSMYNLVQLTNHVWWSGKLEFPIGGGTSLVEQS